MTMEITWWQTWLKCKELIIRCPRGEVLPSRSVSTFMSYSCQKTRSRPRFTFRYGLRHCETDRVECPCNATWKEYNLITITAHNRAKSNIVYQSHQCHWKGPAWTVQEGNMWSFPLYPWHSLHHGIRADNPWHGECHRPLWLPERIAR